MYWAAARYMHLFDASFMLTWNPVGGAQYWHADAWWWLTSWLCLSKIAAFSLVFSQGFLNSPSVTVVHARESRTSYSHHLHCHSSHYISFRTLHIKNGRTKWIKISSLKNSRRLNASGWKLCRPFSRLDMKFKQRIWQAVTSEYSRRLIGDVYFQIQQK